MKLKKKEIDQILKFIKQSDGDELRLEIGDMKLTTKKGASIRIFKEVPVTELDVETKPTVEEEKLIPVTSPSAGIFYRKPEPDAPPYVEMGSFIEVGDTLALIEVMKTFGPVKSEVAGSIVEICVEDGKLVEYGQTLFLIQGATKQ